MSLIIVVVIFGGKLVSYLQLLHTLNFSDITSKFFIGTMFIIVDLKQYFIQNL